jgi:tetratricopeptide (TPR) repeat protein
MQSINYMRLLMNKGPDEAFAYIQKCKDDTVNYTNFNESLINNIAMGELLDNKDHKNNMALTLEALKINIWLFPNSAKTYDSYGWVLSKAGKTEEAIWMYIKSLKINPDDEQVKNVLNELLQKKAGSSSGMCQMAF